jgi:hypothetical protein
MANNGKYRNDCNDLKLYEFRPCGWPLRSPADKSFACGEKALAGTASPGGGA